MLSVRFDDGQRLFWREEEADLSLSLLWTSTAVQLIYIRAPERKLSSQTSAEPHTERHDQTPELITRNRRIPNTQKWSHLNKPRLGRFLRFLLPLRFFIFSPEEIFGSQNVSPVFHTSFFHQSQCQHRPAVNNNSRSLLWNLLKLPFSKYLFCVSPKNTDL